MKILVATDGSDHSLMAAKTLIAMNPPPDAEIVVLHVKEQPYYLISPMVPPPYNEEWHRVQHEINVEAEESAQHAISQAQNLFTEANIKTTSIMSDGHPADRIIHFAQDMRADLVVVGSKGLSGSRLFLLGSVSQRVIKYAQCSVLMTKPAQDASAPKMRKVLLATDGSEHAMEAARFLSAFDLDEDAEIVITHIVHLQHGLIHSRAQAAIEQIQQAMHENARRLIDSTKNMLETRAKVTELVREGDPAIEIIHISRETEADLIVIGSKGMSRIKQYLLGSVSQRVYRYCDRSVMMVKTQRAPNPSIEG